MNYRCYHVLRSIRLIIAMFAVFISSTLPVLQASRDNITTGCATASAASCCMLKAMPCCHRQTSGEASVASGIHLIYAHPIYAHQMLSRQIATGASEHCKCVFNNSPKSRPTGKRGFRSAVEFYCTVGSRCSNNFIVGSGPPACSLHVNSTFCSSIISLALPRGPPFET